MWTCGPVAEAVARTTSRRALARDEEQWSVPLRRPRALPLRAKAVVCRCPRTIVRETHRATTREPPAQLATCCNACRVRANVTCNPVRDTVLRREDRRGGEGVDPRSASRGAGGRPARGRLREDLHRQGVRQARPPPRARQGAARRPRRRPARGHQARPARPLAGAPDRTLKAPTGPRGGPGRARPGHRHLHRRGPDVLPDPRRDRRIRARA